MGVSIEVRHCLTLFSLIGKMMKISACVRKQKKIAHFEHLKSLFDKNLCMSKRGLFSYFSPTWQPFMVIQV